MSKLLIHEPALQVLPTLANELGLTQAIVIQQLHFHSQRSDDGWVAKSVAKWTESDFWFLGEATVKRAFLGLRKRGLLFERKASPGTDQTRAYRIDYDTLEALLPSDQNDPMDRIKTTNSNRSERSDAKGQNDPLLDKGRELETREQRQDVEDLCSLLADLVEANGSKRPAVTDRWRTDARLLLDKDGRELDEVVRVLRWCQADSFWRSNILSLPKFREKYDQLRLRMGATGGGGNPERNARRARRAAALNNLTSQQGG